jgi:8-oxo-dGTP pyrophosphatase MutT (NUDIX family)
MKTAVCAIIIDSDRILAVSRRNDATKWGFPGGKVDPGESTIAALVREVFEETNLLTNACDWVPIHVGVCVGSTSYWVATYLYVGGPIANAEEMKAEEELAIDFMPWHALCDDKKSTFAEYNRRVYLSYSNWNSNWSIADGS